MAVTLREVDHLTRLARIGLSKNELQELKKDLEDILRYAEVLQEVSTHGLKPISHITGLENEGRKDEIKPTLANPDDLLEAVPERQGRWVKVLRIIRKNPESNR